MWLSKAYKYWTIVLLGLLYISLRCDARAVNVSNTWTMPQEGLNVFYRFFRDRISWFEADAVCQFHHANLVTVDNSFQFDATRDLLRELDVNDIVWIGLMRPQNSDRFMWSNSRPLVTDTGYWAESLPLMEAPLCAVIDPIRDYRWHALRCGGPETASFLCEMPVPVWADACILKDMPNLTMQYMADTASIELIRNCQEEGLLRQTCKGKEDRDRALHELICPKERLEAQRINDITNSHFKSLQIINSIRTDNNENNDIELLPMVPNYGADIVTINEDIQPNQEKPTEQNTVQRLIEQFNVDELMQADEPIISYRIPTVIPKPVKKISKKVTTNEEYMNKLKAEHQPSQHKAKQQQQQQQKQKSITFQEKIPIEDMMMGDQPIGEPEILEHLSVDDEEVSNEIMEHLPHKKKVLPQDLRKLATLPEEVLPSDVIEIPASTTMIIPPTAVKKALVPASITHPTQKEILTTSVAPKTPTTASPSTEHTKTTPSQSPLKVTPAATTTTTSPTYTATTRITESPIATTNVNKLQTTTQPTTTTTSSTSALTLISTTTLMPITEHVQQLHTLSVGRINIPQIATQIPNTIGHPIHPQQTRGSNNYNNNSNNNHNTGNSSEEITQQHPHIKESVDNSHFIPPMLLVKSHYVPPSRHEHTTSAAPALTEQHEQHHHQQQQQQPAINAGQQPMYMSTPTSAPTATTSKTFGQTQTEKAYIEEQHKPTAPATTSSATLTTAATETEHKANDDDVTQLSHESTTITAATTSTNLLTTTAKITKLQAILVANEEPLHTKKTTKKPEPTAAAVVTTTAAPTIITTTGPGKANELATHTIAETLSKIVEKIQTTTSAVTVTAAARTEVHAQTTPTTPNMMTATATASANPTTSSTSSSSAATSTSTTTTTTLGTTNQPNAVTTKANAAAYEAPTSAPATIVSTVWPTTTAAATPSKKTTRVPTAPAVTTTTTEPNFLKAETEAPFKPNRRRSLTKPETVSYFKKILG